MDDLAAGVHPGVGAAGTGQRGGLAHAGRPAEGVAQGPRHGRDLGLEGEAAEGGTVVGDQEPPALQLRPQPSSIRRHELAQIDAGT